MFLRIKNAKLITINYWLGYFARWSAVLVAFWLPISTALTDIFFVMTVALMIISGRFIEFWDMVKQSRVASLLLLLALLIFVGIFYSSATWPVALDTLKKYSHLLLGLFFWPLFKEARWRNYAINAFLISMSIVLVASYLNYFQVVQLSQHYDPASVFKSHIETNFLMAFTAYLIAWMWMKNRRWWLAVFLLLAIYNILFMSDGRSGYIVFISLFILFVWQHYPWKGLLVGFIGLCLLLGVAFSFSKSFRFRFEATAHYVQLFRQRQANESPDFLRLEFYKNSLKLIQKHPIIGTGTGSFYHEYHQLDVPSQVYTSDPTNEYLNIAVQLGAIGLFFMLYLFFVHWRDTDLLLTDLSRLAQATLVSIAVGCLFNSWLMSTTQGHFYSYFVALLFASQFNNETRKTVVVKRTLNRVTVYIKKFHSPVFQQFLARPEAWLRTAQFFKNRSKDTTTVAKVTVEGRHFVVKRYNFRNFFHALKVRLRPSYALRSWYNAKYLSDCGVPAIRPVAVIEHRIGPLRGKGYFISEFQSGVRGSDYFASEGANWTLAAPAIKQLYNQLQEVLMVHRDLRPGNLLMTMNKPILLDLEHALRFRFRSRRFLKKHQADKEHFLYYIKRDYPNLFDLFAKLLA